MTDLNHPSQVPSRSVSLLKGLIGQRLVNLVRYSWWPKESVPDECGVQSSEAFSMTAGPLAMIFANGAVLGLASDPSLNSVVVWLDKSSDGSVLRDPSMADDPEIFPIEASDDTFSQANWAGLLGEELSNASVLCVKQPSALKSELPNEVGLRLQFGGQGAFIAGHGLHDGSDDFAVLSLEQLSPTMRQQVEERPLF